MGGLGCVALAEHAVEVAGLIVLIAGVDALGLDQIPFRAQGVVGGGLDGAGVGKGEHAVVLRGGGLGGVDREGVWQVAGGQHLAGQELGNAVGAVSAGVADPDDGVDGLVLLELLDFHGGGGVEQHHDLAEALGLDPVQKIPLVVGQAQDVARGALRELLGGQKTVAAGIEAGGLARVAAKDDHGGVVVGRHVHALVVGDGDLLDLGARILIVADDVAARRTAGGVVALHILVELDQRGVDRKAVFGHGLVERHDIGGVRQLAHRAAELHLRARAHAKQADPGAAERGLPLERNRALIGQAGVEPDLGANQVCRVGIVGDKAIILGIVAALEGVVGNSKHLVDLAGPGVGNGAEQAEDHEQRQEDAGNAAIDMALLLHVVLLSFSLAGRACRC